MLYPFKGRDHLPASILRIQGKAQPTMNRNVHAQNCLMLHSRNITNTMLNWIDKRVEDVFDENTQNQLKQFREFKIPDVSNYSWFLISLFIDWIDTLLLFDSMFCSIKRSKSFFLLCVYLLFSVAFIPSELITGMWDLSHFDDCHTNITFPVLTVQRP